MGFYDEEYRKGYQRGLQGAEEPESPMEDLNIFRSDKEKEARMEGFEAGKKQSNLKRNYNR